SPSPVPHHQLPSLSLQSLPSRARPSSPELRVNAHGFSLHAALRWRADQRLELEQLCRYITRPPIANERLKRNRAGQVVLQLKTPYKDGTADIVVEPLEFMDRLSALVPRPRLHLIRSGAIRYLLCASRPLSGRVDRYNSEFFIKHKRELTTLPILRYSSGHR